MDELARLVIPLVYFAQAQPPASGVIPTLLTGGGFVFLGVMMTGLFMWNKNKADSANTVAQGAATWAEGMSKELAAYKNWSGRQREANRAHSQWDDEFIDKFCELIKHCEEHDIIGRGSITVVHPPSLDVPFDDPFISGPRLAAQPPPNV